MVLKKNPFALLASLAVESVHRRLIAWFRKSRRDLPWRRTRDPYRIWVSEVMLQQTQVPTVLPYYERFLKRFPTVGALARAPQEAVLKVWQGLGYYRRAQNLQAAARAVVRDHGGRVPDDPAAFARLPGVGRYTCGAVQSIAFGRRLAALDGNAVRVIARWFATTDSVDRSAVRAGLWDLAETLVPGSLSGVARPRGCSRDRAFQPSSPKGGLDAPRMHGHGKGAVAVPPGFANPSGDWNQAIMELGSRLCTPRSPQCTACPVRRHCRAAAKGIQDRVPVRRKRRPIPHIEVGAGVVWRRGRVLLCTRRADAMLGGLWEFPGGKRRRGETLPACIRRELKEECGLAVTVGRHLVDVTHAYTHLRVTLRCYHCRAGRGRVRLLGCDDARWVLPRDIPKYPLPAADVRILEALSQVQGPKSKARRDGAAEVRRTSRRLGP